MADGAPSGDGGLRSARRAPASWSAAWGGARPSSSTCRSPPPPLAMTLALIPQDARPAARPKIAEVATRIDLGGIAVSGGMLAALLVFLMSLPRPHWVAPAISAILAALLVAWELRAPRPFLDPRLL